MKLFQAIGDSKKAQALLVGGALAAFGPTLGMTEEQISNIITVVVGYTVAQGVADAGKGFNGKGTAQP